MNTRGMQYRRARTFFRHFKCPESSHIKCPFPDMTILLSETDFAGVKFLFTTRFAEDTERG